jgi:hypothetical protein
MKHEFRNRQNNRFNNKERNIEFMKGEPVPEFPFYIPEFPEMPTVVKKKSFEERKKLLQKFVEVTLTKNKIQWSKQGDTYFSDLYKEKIDSFWGRACYDLIFLKDGNRFVNFVRSTGKTY